MAISVAAMKARIDVELADGNPQPVILNTAGMEWISQAIAKGVVDEITAEGVPSGPLDHAAIGTNLDWGDSNHTSVPDRLASFDGSGNPTTTDPVDFEVAGAAAAAVATHVATGDPHSEYQKESEKDNPSGYAGLDGSQLVLASRLGTGSIGEGKYLKGNRVWSDLNSTVAGVLTDGGGGSDFLANDGTYKPITSGTFDHAALTSNLAWLTSAHTGGNDKLASWDAGGTLELLDKTYFQVQDDDLDALAALAATGVAVRTGASTWTVRTITGTANQVNVADGDGVGANPVLSLPQDIHTGASPTFTGGTFSSDLLVQGNLTVEGSSFVSDPEIIALGANYIYQNTGYTTAAAQSGGLAINYLPTATTDTVNGSYVAGVPATSNPTVTTTGSGTFSASDIIQISGSDDNDGFFEVLTHTGTTLTVRGIGLTTTVEDWSRNDLLAGASDGATITKLNLSVFRAGADGDWEAGKGSVTGVTFSNVLLDSDIGGSLQAYDAGLANFAALAMAANKMAYTTADNVWASTDLTSLGRTLLGDATQGTMHTTLGLVPGTDVQAYSANLLTLAGIVPGAAGQAILADATAGDVKTYLSLVPGTDIQAYDAGLLSIAGLTTAADRMIYTTGMDAYAVATLTTAGRALLDDVSASAQRTTLGFAGTTNRLAYWSDANTVGSSGDWEFSGANILPLITLTQAVGSTAQRTSHVYTRRLNMASWDSAPTPGADDAVFQAMLPAGAGGSDPIYPGWTYDRASTDYHNLIPFIEDSGLAVGEMLYLADTGTKAWAAVAGTKTEGFGLELDGSAVPTWTKKKNYRRLVRTSNVTNSTTSLATTGLAMDSLVSGTRYWFRVHIFKSEAASTTGIGFDWNGLAQTYFYCDIHVRRDNASASGARMAIGSSAIATLLMSTSGDTDILGVTLEGTCQPSASGTLTLRFRSEVGASLVTIYEGSYIEWGVLDDV